MTGNPLILNLVVLATIVVAALLTVMTVRLIWAAIALAITSALVAILMLRLDSPIAAMFELSVCAGLIPAILISAISLTQPQGRDIPVGPLGSRFTRFFLLPLLVLAVGVVLSQVRLPLDFVAAAPAAETDVREVLWTLRHVDLLGQVAVLLAGAFAVVILIKEFKREP